MVRVPSLSAITACTQNKHMTAERDQSDDQRLITGQNHLFFPTSFPLSPLRISPENLHYEKFSSHYIEAEHSITFLLYLNVNLSMSHFIAVWFLM